MKVLPEIKIEDYNYPLPDSRIAKYPLENRDSSKLLVFKNGVITSSEFNSLAKHLPENSHLVFNNTKVIPARLFFKKKSGALIQLFLLDPIKPSNVISQVMESANQVSWKCLIGNKKKWKGEILELAIDTSNKKPIHVTASLENPEEDIISFKWNSDISFSELLNMIGQMPLPPYLNRETEETDKKTYQTVYSKLDGAVAAPTAGLHFTANTFESLKSAKIETSFITLHVGAGTFQPVKTENALDHHMHSEQIVFSKSFLKRLADNNEKIIAVGTTSLRSLESLYWYGVKILKEKSNLIPFKIEKLFPYQFDQSDLPSLKEVIGALIQYIDDNKLDELSGETEIYIFPGYQFQICKGLVTNFHQPKSTLLLLVSALIGERWKEIYTYCLENDYRFLSYGDSSLLLPIGGATNN